MPTKLVPLTLEQHQEILYEILYMVDDFCKAHDIPYFLVGGSLLGAVRHLGIIPWDDDVDIAMTRENYNRFIELFHAEGVEGYELYDSNHKKGYLFPFAKMAKTDTWTSNAITRTIHIDIFPYDGCGDTKDDALTFFMKEREKIETFWYRYILNIPFNQLYDCWKSKLVYLVTKMAEDIKLFYPIYIYPNGKKKCINRICSKLSRFSVTHTKFSACIAWGIYGEGEVQPSSSFLKLNKMRFSTRELPVPSGWHEYLTGIYGDYMTPLPKNKRVRHTETSYLIVKQ